jgi:dolichol-phosphate mannosyltransferase
MMYSIIAPIFNEERILPELFRRLSGVLSELDAPAEVILVDDGSRDRSFDLMREFSAQDKRFRMIRLSRNFGHQVAISAGLDHARGDAVVFMDGDLQDPPELIPTMIRHWKAGHQVVYTVKRSRKENALKRLAFRGFYSVMQSLSSVRIPAEAGNFSLLDRKAADTLRSMPERNRYISGLRAWIGYRQIGIEYDRDARYAGKPRMTLLRLMRLAFDGIFSFSLVPLRLATVIGFLAAFVAFLGMLFVLYEKLISGRAILGWTSTIVSVTFLGGLILMTLGIVGEYVGRIYDEVKHRPLYIVSERAGFEEEPASRRS